MCRFKGDTSETRFQSLCKMTFLAPRTGHIWKYSCPFDLVSSRIDSYKCPLQNKVLGFQYIFFTQHHPKMTDFLPKKAQKRPKRVETAPKRASKWGQKIKKMAFLRPKTPKIHVKPLFGRSKSVVKHLPVVQNRLFRVDFDCPSQNTSCVGLPFGPQKKSIFGPSQSIYCGISLSRLCGRPFVKP